MLGHVNVPGACAHAERYTIDVGWGGGCSLAHMVDAPPHGSSLNLRTWSLHTYLYCYMCTIWCPLSMYSSCCLLSVPDRLFKYRHSYRILQQKCCRCIAVLLWRITKGSRILQTPRLLLLPTFTNKCCTQEKPGRVELFAKRTT